MSSINTKQIPMVCLWLAVMCITVFERVVVLLYLRITGFVYLRGV